MSRTQTLRVDREEAGTRLDLFLAARVDGLSRKRAKRIIDARRVEVAGRVEPMASCILKEGEEVLVRFPPDTRATPPPRLSLLVRTEHFVAVDKPPELPSGPTKDPHRPHAQQLAEQQVSGPLTLLHQLDRDTSGVLLLGRTDDFSKPLSAAFRERRVDKIYIALVSGSPPEVFEIDCHLREEKSGRVAVVRSGGARARTRFETLATGEGLALVRCFPSTGRKHQLRVQLAHRGFPILGDLLYGGMTRLDVGGEKTSVGRQMLHASRLAFDHPVTGERMELEAPLPEDVAALVQTLFGELHLPL